LNDYLLQFEGKYAGMEEIYASVRNNESLKTAIRMSISRYEKAGLVFRVGRGAYGFFPKPSYVPKLSDKSIVVIKKIRENFPYLDFSVTDTLFLSDFMNLQPFTSILLIETLASAINPIISFLQKSEIAAYMVKDYSNIEQYIKSDVIILLRPTMSVNPKPIMEKGLWFSCLEKILVDLVCDDNIFSQYQDNELENIFRNVTDMYAINYSKLLKYAKARNRKADCADLLELTEEYIKVRDLL